MLRVYYVRSKVSNSMYCSAMLKGPLKGPELSTLNLAWVQSSILWQYFLSYANTLKKRIKRYNIKGIGSLLLISIIFYEETEQ